ncbi:MAG: M50 family metallopeptidase [Oscillospiraceae bacterium]
MSFILMILVAVLVFGAVIFIHELGHFATAKWSGIKVNEFAIGMGPTLFKVKKKETTYALRLLPIGGFVSMEGEDEESSDDRSFEKAPIYKRLIVIVAGAFMNVVLGFAALVVLVAFSNGDLVASRTVAAFYENASTQASGLQVGDTILAVNGRRCFVVNDIFYEFARTQNGTVALTVMRDGQKTELPAVVFDTEPVTDEQTGETTNTMVVDFKVLGIQKGVLSVAKEAFLNTVSYARLIYLSLVDLVTGRAAINQLSGPVGIVNEIGKAVSIGWQPVVQMLALISVNLGVVNMLPLPALDGGKALLLIVEGIRRKPLNRKLEIAINVAGFALLMLLMVVVSFNDIRKLFF